MKKYLSAIVAFTALTTVAHAFIQVDINTPTTPFSLLIDPYETIQLEGLPYQGVYLYSKKEDALYIQHPDEPNWLRLPLYPIVTALPKVMLEKGALHGEFLGKSNRHWVLRVGARVCDHVFTSHIASQKTGFDINHINRINAGLAYLFKANTAQNSCALYNITPAMGKLLGLPIHTSGANGKIDVTRMLSHKGNVLPLPTDAKPFDMPAQVRFLKRQLTPEMRQAFSATSAKIPLMQQLKALRSLISQQNAGSSLPRTP